MASPLVINPTIDGRLIYAHSAHIYSFSDICLGPGNDCQTNLAAASVTLKADTTENMWNYIHRLAAIFDTSALPDDCTIDSATLAFKVEAKTDDLSCTPSLGLYAGNMASDVAIVATDYATVGTTPLAAAIAYGDIAIGANSFVLNAAGLAAISKTGKTKFAIRNANYDAINNAPAWSSAAVSAVSIAMNGSSWKLVLTIQYTEAAPPAPIVWSGTAAAKPGNHLRRGMM